MSAHRLCNAYGAHEPYCPMVGYPIEVERADDVARWTLTSLRAQVEELRGDSDPTIGYGVNCVEDLIDTALAALPPDESR